MPRDDFERLERRWRERPLFCERTTRKPWWIVLLVVLGTGILLGISALGLPSLGQLSELLSTIQIDTSSNQTADAASIRLRIPPALK